MVDGHFLLLIEMEKYFIEEKIGQGSYGDVYRCLNLMDQQYYAMKKISIDAEHGNGISSTTLREISFLKSFSRFPHENIIE